MTNHPNRSRHNRTVVFKIVDGGLARCSNHSESDLAIQVTNVPSNVPDTRVMMQLRKIVILPVLGPWLIPWERLAAAMQGSILRDCKQQ